MGKELCLSDIPMRVLKELLTELENAESPKVFFHEDVELMRKQAEMNRKRNLHNAVVIVTKILSHDPSVRPKEI